MIDRKLKIGDYIFTADGHLAKITKINNASYFYAMLDLPGNRGSCFFSGANCPHRYHGGYGEWFYCDEPGKKALEAALAALGRQKEAYAIAETSKDVYAKNSELMSKAKYLLSQLEDVQPLPVDERSEDDYDWYDDMDDDDDWPDFDDDRGAGDAGAKA